MHCGTLVRFTGDPAGPDVSYDVRRERDRLQVRFAVAPLDDVVWPASATSPHRRDGLWTGTCLECFVAGLGDDRYWEFNLSPAGDWNAYAFDGYRDGMRPELAIDRISGDERTAMVVPLNRLALTQVTLEVAVCAVLQLRDGSRIHYALEHPGARPDFHRRQSFWLCLPASSRYPARA